MSDIYVAVYISLVFPSSWRVSLHIVHMYILPLWAMEQIELHIPNRYNNLEDINSQLWSWANGKSRDQTIAVPYTSNSIGLLLLGGRP